MIESFVPALALLAFIKKVVDVLRYVRGKEWNGVITQIVVWVAAIVIVLLAGETEFASGITVGDTTLDGLSTWSLIFVGLTIGSTASFAEDALAATDNTRSTAKPHLIDGPPLE